MKIIKLSVEHENQLIKKAKKGDRLAQRDLYEKYSSKMLSLCNRYIKDTLHAEDVMIKGFFKVFTKLRSFKNTGSFEGWIKTIMIRESLTFLTKKSKIVFQNDVYDTDSYVEENIEGSLDMMYLQSLIDDLPEGYRVIFILHAVEGYKHSEIGKLLGITESTSKSQFFKARKTLQQKLPYNKTRDYGTI